MNAQPTDRKPPALRALGLGSGGVVYGEVELPELIEDFGFVDGTIRGTEIGIAGVSEKAPGGFVTLGLVIGLELFGDEVESLNDQDAEVVGAG